jgi:tetratricopeptide (TPR) repeat protein
MMTFGIVHINSGKDALAKALLLESLPIYSQLGLTYFESLTLVHLANASLGLGDYAGATEYLDKATAISQNMHEGWLDSFALNNRGEVARAQGQYEEARAYYQESERLLREMGDVGDLARLVHTLGYIAQHEGDLELAETRFRESLAIFEKVGNQRGIAECLAGLAGLRAQQGNPQKAATILAAAAATQDVTGAAWWPADRVEIERNAESIRAALDEVTFAAAQEAGRSLALDQAITLALAES